MNYFDRLGNPMSTEEWAEMIEDDEYRAVLATTLPDGTGVSTIWTGMPTSPRFDHVVPPLIFETAVFEGTGGNRIDEYRWPSLAEAREGHQKVCDEYLARRSEDLKRLDQLS